MYRKKMENVRCRTQNWFKTRKQQEDYLKWKSKPSYTSQKHFKNLDNDLVTIQKSNVRLKHNKAVYVGMCILDLIKYWCTSST